MRWLALLLLPLSLHAAEPVETRRYDQTAWLCTHNAMSNEAEGWKFANQNKDLRGQFDDGVRAFMLDLHPQDGGIVLRHGPEAARILGSKPLAKELTELRNLLEAHPQAIITLILESYVPAKDVAEAFTAAGLAAYTHTQVEGQPWPTLQEMIKHKQRLVVFTDRPDGGPAWMMDVWQHAWETPFSAKKPADLKNMRNRGRKDSPLLILNHFCADPLPSKSTSRQINSHPFLRERLAAARTALGRDPNFLVVDFHDLGDARQAVEELNRKQ